jgi:hypothetical protein
MCYTPSSEPFRIYEYKNFAIILGNINQVFTSLIFNHWVIRISLGARLILKLYFYKSFDTQKAHINLKFCISAVY